MSKYGVLVVDDSAVMRKAISTIVEKHPDFYIIGKARNGKEALEKMERLQPNVITMDIEMPELDGLRTIRQVLESNRSNIVVISNFEEDSSEALELGVADAISKEWLLHELSETQISEFHERLLTIAHNTYIPTLLHSNAGIQNVQFSKSLDSDLELVMIVLLQVVLLRSKHY